MKNLFFLIVVLTLTACESKSGMVSEKIQRINGFIESIDSPLCFEHDTITEGNKITLLTFPDTISQQRMMTIVANAIMSTPDVYRVAEWENDSINNCQFGFVVLESQNHKDDVVICVEVFTDNYLGIAVNLF